MGKSKRNFRGKAKKKKKQTVAPPPKRLVPYIQRNAILRRMGYSSYSQYLTSEEWKQIRLKVLRRDGFTCQSCKAFRATQVHHTRYDLPTLSGRNLSGMMSVCRMCHRTAEFRSGQYKTSLPEANTRITSFHETMAEERRRFFHRIEQET